MRRSAISAIAMIAFALSGCTSSSGPEALVAGLPSREVTSSVKPAAPVPAAVVGEAKPLAWAEDETGSAPLAAMATTVGMPTPSSRPLGMLLPDNPAGAGPVTRSRIYSQRFSDAKPINFGKVQPQHYAVHGVDVSRWQGEIDWPKLRTQGANFAYIKATDGGDHLDPMFKTNWQRAKEAGIRRGAYHFFYW